LAEIVQLGKKRKQPPAASQSVVRKVKKLEENEEGERVVMT